MPNYTLRQKVIRSIVLFTLRHSVFFFFILLPFNVIYRVYHRIKKELQALFEEKSNEKTHRKRVEKVQMQVKEWNRLGRSKKMCTGRPKAQSLMLRLPKYRDTLHAIQVGQLKDVVSLDVERRVVKVEPLVSTSQLTAYLNPLGWTVPVVPELGALTVGGLVMGGGLETSSNKYGLFHKTCVSFEVVMSNGDVKTCSKTENEELFRGIPISYGTLALLTAVEIEIIKAPPFVRLEYHPMYSLEDALKFTVKQGNDIKRNDFVEAMGYSKNEWVVMTGKRVANPEPNKVIELTWWYSEWFHKHIESYLKSGPGYNFISVRDYYHRYDRSFGWAMQSYIPYGNHPLFRYLFGWTLPVETTFLKSIIPSTFFTETQFIQDFLVRAEGMSEIILESDRLTKIYPVWICPFKMHAADGAIATSGTDKNEMFYDVGVYGKPVVPNANVMKITMELEKLVLKYKGIQALYTDSYMTEEELRRCFDLRLLDKLRKQYDAEDAFPDFYSKTSVRGRQKGL